MSESDLILQQTTPLDAEDGLLCNHLKMVRFVVLSMFVLNGNFERHFYDSNLFHRPLPKLGDITQWLTDCMRWSTVEAVPEDVPVHPFDVSFKAVLKVLRNSINDCTITSPPKIKGDTGIGHTVGHIALMRVDLHNKTAEIGFNMIAPVFQHKGLAIF